MAINFFKKFECMLRIIVSIIFIFLFKNFACAQNSESLMSGVIKYPDCGDFNHLDSYIDSIAKGDLNKWIEIIDTLNDVDSVGHLYCRLHYIENKMLGIHGALVSRKNEKLTFKLDNGLKKVFTDKPDFPDRDQYGIFYFFDKYYTEINSYLIQYYGMEFGGFKLVNKANGSIVDLPNRPIVSPDKKHFILFNVDMDSEYTPNVISIYRVLGGCKIVYQDYFLNSIKENELLKFPNKAVWLNDKEIKITQSCYDENYNENINCGNYKLVFTDKWKKVINVK